MAGVLVALASPPALPCPTPGGASEAGAGRTLSPSGGRTHSASGCTSPGLFCFPGGLLTEAPEGLPARLPASGAPPAQLLLHFPGTTRTSSLGPLLQTPPSL